MKTSLTLLLALTLFGSGFAAAAPARERTSKQIKGKDYAADIDVLEQSQELALQLGKEALGKLEDREDRAKMGKAVQLIGDAKTLLVAAKTQRGKLDEVIRKQEEAFQILLELASKEHRITRSKSPSPSSGSPKERQEMEDLELKMKENQYESRRLAKPEEQQNEEQAEQLQVLNRLRELARRQNDINERLKQLQTQLQAADDTTEKEELQRQLKRLL
ncbi:MAG: hypothetical protein ISQ14_08745, partial [Verrucomicrobiae bacterium]|nr:hypothetical protein [Verrucomicrobiae bacterium]